MISERSQSKSIEPEEAWEHFGPDFVLLDDIKPPQRIELAASECCCRDSIWV
jgi:hypothetical protein